MLGGKQHRGAQLALFGALGLAAWLRGRYVLTVQPNPDEFVSLLAIRSILDRGLPILPSNLFYEHGLLFSYAGALGAWIFGYSRTVVRLVSLLLSLGTIGLVYYVGWRWFSVWGGLVAAFGLAVAPAAVLWGGRVRMYALLQLFVTLLIFVAVEGVLRDRSRWRWLALGLYLAALLTQFVSFLLGPALVVTLVIVGWVQGRNAEMSRPWYRQPRAVWEAIALVVVSLAGILVKRTGQPQGIDPLAPENALQGVGQVLTIYSDFNPDLGAAWRSLAGFYVGPEALLPTGLAIITLIWLAYRLRQVFSQPGRGSSSGELAALALALLLLLTTVEALLVAPPDRRDEKYLFMLMPALFLLAGQAVHLGLSLVGRLTDGQIWRQVGLPRAWKPHLRPFFGSAALVSIVALAYPATADLLADTGENYDAAFGYVGEHWQEGDAILTGTPAAAAFYLGRNDFYAVQAGGRYDYRILEKDGQLVERWLGSVWINTPDKLHRALAEERVWLVLERWGLLVEYYDSFFRQNLLAQTEFVREDNGLIVLRSRPDPLPVAEMPRWSVKSELGGPQTGQIALLGYTLEPATVTADQRPRLTLYWQTQAPLAVDYTVFVHLRTGCGTSSAATDSLPEPCQGLIVAQADHAPLGSIYPTTLWPVAEVIRETSFLSLPPELPPGTYQLWVGLYRLETLERLPVRNDPSGENAVLLGEVIVP